MSTCISSHGEYSEHRPGSVPFTCEFCGVFDEAGIVAEVAALRGQVQRSERLAYDAFVKADLVRAALDPTETEDWGPCGICRSAVPHEADECSAADIANAYNAQFGVKPPKFSAPTDESDVIA